MADVRNVFKDKVNELILLIDKNNLEDFFDEDKIDELRELLSELKLAEEPDYLDDDFTLSDGWYTSSGID